MMKSLFLFQIVNAVHGAGSVGRQEFAAGKHVGNTAEFFCAVFADLQNAHAFLEVPNTERGRIAGGAGGRKNMVRAGTVVA